MANITIKIEGLDALRGALKRYPTIATKHLQKAINDGVAVIHNLSARQKGIVPVKTGNLSNTFKMKPATLNQLRGSVWPTAKYAKFVNDGTRPHTITAKGKGLSDGKRFFGKSVKHPGFKGRKYMEKLAKTATPKIQDKFNKATENIVEEIAKQAK